MSADTSGPAFPVPEVFDERRDEVTQYGSTGISIRDYFAAKAMQGWLSTYPTDMEAQLASYSAYVLAAFAYQVADAMLKERAK